MAVKDTGITKTSGHEEKTSNLTFEAAIVMVLSASAYMIAYVYELGYATHFGIETGLVEASPYTSGAIAIAVIFILYMWMQVATIFNMLPESKIKLLVKTAFYRNIFLIGFLIYFYIDDYAELNLAITLTILMLVLPLLADIHIAIMRYIDYKRSTLDNISLTDSFLHTMKANDENEREIIRDNHPIKRENPFSIALGILLIAFIILALIFTTGRVMASKRAVFGVYNHEWALVRVYGDKTVAVKFNPETNIIGNEYIVMNSNNLHYSLKKTGRLSAHVLARKAGD